jgi:hypothetical protein
MKLAELMRKYEKYVTKMVAVSCSALNDKSKAKNVDWSKLPPGYDFKSTLNEILTEATQELDDLEREYKAEFVKDRVSFMNEEPVTDFVKALFYYQTTFDLMKRMGVPASIEYLSKMKGTTDLSKLEATRKAVRVMVEKVPESMGAYEQARRDSLTDTEREAEVCLHALERYEYVLKVIKTQAEVQVVGALADIHSKDADAVSRLVKMGDLFKQEHERILKYAKDLYGVAL